MTEISANDEKKLNEARQQLTPTQNILYQAILGLGHAASLEGRQLAASFAKLSEKKRIEVLDAIARAGVDLTKPSDSVSELQRALADAIAETFKGVPSKRTGINSKVIGTPMGGQSRY